MGNAALFDTRSVSAMKKASIKFVDAIIEAVHDFRIAIRDLKLANPPKIPVMLVRCEPWEGEGTEERKNATILDEKRADRKQLSQKTTELNNIGREESRQKTTKAEELVEQARVKLGMDVVNHYNFAFVGQSGCGKSSLINAFLMLNDADPGAAPVGETETTEKIKRYIHPILHHVALWDIPGAGTLQQPAETYFEKQLLYAFDCILIISADRFLEVDFAIAKKAIEFNRAFAFVRTKADLGVRSIARRTKKTMLEASHILREQVTSSFKEEARLHGLATQLSKCKLFIVSAWAIRNTSAYANGRDLSLQGMDEVECLKFVSGAVDYRTA